MAMIQIGGLDLPDPSSFSVVPSDLESDSTKRNELGILQRDCVRLGMRKLSCKWNALAFSQASAIIQAVSPSRFNVKYLDPESGGYKEITAYAGDRTCDMVAAGGGSQRWNISLDFIQF